MKKNGKKFVFLSKKSACIVSDWCERNPGSKLAEAYYEACHGLSFKDLESKITQERKDFDKKIGRYKEDANGMPARWQKHYYEHMEVQNYAFMARDSIGRIILDMVKDREKWRQGLRESRQNLNPKLQ